MRRTCIDCGALTPMGMPRCGPCRATWLAGRRVYGSAAWRRIATEAIAAADSCAYCRRADVKLTADHVVAIRSDPSRALDPSNVVACCRSCQERRKHDPTWWGGRA